MKNICKYAILIALSAMVISCNDAKKEDSAVIEDSAEKVETAPIPMKVYTKDGVSVNAYNFEGLEYFMKKENDTTYIVNFWATWCVPCVEELPHFEKLNAEYKDNKVKVVLVSLDMHKMIESKLIPFIQERQLQSDVVLLRDPDADSWIPKVDSSWSGAIPATLIYNKDKRKFYENSFTYEQLENEIKNFK